LRRRLEKRWGPDIFGTGASGLRIDRGSCVGIEARRGGDRLHIGAEVIVTADGGLRATPICSASISARAPTACSCAVPTPRSATAQDGRGGGRGHAYARPLLRPSSRSRRDGQFRAVALPQIETPPFFGLPTCAGITNTMGGIAIDGHGRVRRPDGTLIDDLYTKGGTTGGARRWRRARLCPGVDQGLRFSGCASQRTPSAPVTDITAADPSFCHRAAQSRYRHSTASGTA
jgi:hypothetical protein